MNPLTYAKIATIVVVFFAGWWVNGWRWESKWTARELSLAEAHAKTTDAYREREHVLQDAIGMLDVQYTAQLKEANDANATLRAAVDTGAKRLLVRAKCPAAPGVPQTTDRPGVDNGAGAELAADARQDYFALREGLTRFEKKLAACQSTLAGERQ